MKYAQVLDEKIIGLKSLPKIYIGPIPGKMRHFYKIEEVEQPVTEIVKQFNEDTGLYDDVEVPVMEKVGELIEGSSKYKEVEIPKTVVIKRCERDSNGKKIKSKPSETDVETMQTLPNFDTAFKNPEDYADYDYYRVEEIRPPKNPDQAQKVESMVLNKEEKKAVVTYYAVDKPVKKVEPEPEEAVVEPSDN